MILKDDSMIMFLRGPQFHPKPLDWDRLNSDIAPLIGRWAYREHVGVLVGDQYRPTVGDARYKASAVRRIVESNIVSEFDPGRHGVLLARDRTVLVEAMLEIDFSFGSFGLRTTKLRPQAAERANFRFDPSRPLYATSKGSGSWSVVEVLDHSLANDYVYCRASWRLEVELRTDRRPLDDRFTEEDYANALKLKNVRDSRKT